MRTVSLVLLIALVASLASAQPVSLGRLEPSADTTTNPGPNNAPYSFIDLGHPARVAGTVNNASVYWQAGVGGGVCTGAFTLYFLRASGSGFSYNVVAKRGPFDANNGRTDVTLSPGVDVQPYDLMGITLDKPVAGCGTVYQKYVSPDAAPVLMTTTDLANGLGTNFQIRTGSALNIVATNTYATTVQTIPAAGSTAGSFGAFFRTGVQLLNNSPANISGKLIFHPQGTTGSSSDPALTFNLVPGQLAAYSDLVTQMGQSGVGSVDIVTNGSAPLNVTAHVFNDNGAAGTNGFYEEPARLDEALQGNQLAYLILPSDTANFRTNIGVRSLAGGATLNAILFISGGGGTLGTNVTKTYPPDFFEQKSAEQLFGVASIPPGCYIRFQVSSGAAIVYGSVTDNRTNDSAVHVVKP